MWCAVIVFFHKVNVKSSGALVSFRRSARTIRSRLPAFDTRELGKTNEGQASARGRNNHSAFAYDIRESWEKRNKGLELSPTKGKGYTSMQNRGLGGGGHGAAGGASLGAGRRSEGEGKLRIHLKRSCTDRKLVQGNTELGLTTDGELGVLKVLPNKTKIMAKRWCVLVKRTCQV